MRLLVRWLISAISLLIVDYIVPGFHVSGFGGALIVAAVIGFINSTLGLLLKIITFPIWILTFGLFLIVINAAMLKLAAFFLPGIFEVRTWGTAIIGAILLTLVSAFLHWLVGDKRREAR
ncbi:MAG TPA: phage holin family protein [Candidatus Angelobacter sp.]|nr:phage holin family protein [Candidatus Angelobacter sp.]